MKILIHIFLAILFSVLQPTWFDAWEIFGVKPNLFLIYIILVSCYTSRKEGAITGFFFGLMLDLLICENVGTNAVLMAITGFFTSQFCEYFIRKNTLPLSVLMVTAVVFFYEFVYYIVSHIGHLNMGATLIRVLLPESIYSALVTVPMYFVVKKISKKYWSDKGELIG